MRTSALDLADPSPLERMHNTALALVSGALLLLTNAAVVALQLESTSWLWWTASALMVVCHAAMGFVAIGGGEAMLEERRGAVAICAMLTLVTTTIAAAGALWAALTFPVALGWGPAVGLVAVCLAAGSGLTVMIGLPLVTAARRTHRVVGS